ncbi:MAG: glycosyltransferase [Verrucomicrobia bacterium]|nr:glycosyltransferase [Verrucomicrobiota bacterium]
MSLRSTTVANGHGAPLGLAVPGPESWVQERLRTILLASLPKPHFERACVLGCGDGALTAALARRCDQLVSVASTEEALLKIERRAGGLANVKFERRQLPDQWPEGRFDLIVLGDTGIEFEATERARLAWKVRASLRPDGFVVGCTCSDRGGTGKESVANELGRVFPWPCRTRHEENGFRLEIWPGSAGSSTSPALTAPPVARDLSIREPAAERAVEAAAAEIASPPPPEPALSAGWASVLREQFRPPARGLSISVVIPARDEELEIVACLQGLAHQTEISSDAFEVLLLAHNCRDRTAEMARQFARQHRGLDLQVAELALPTEHAHVGSARRLLLNLAAERLALLGQRRRGGVLATTDADTVVDPAWLRQTLQVLRQPGVAAVGGYITPRPESLRRWPLALQQRRRADLRYRLLATQLAERIDPTPGDPWPRHFFHRGASLAVRQSAYQFVGGMPALADGGDREFVRGLLRRDLVVRHEFSVRVRTSARGEGRVEHGRAASWQRWARELAEGAAESRVESASSIRERALLLAEIRDLHRRGVAPGHWLWQETAERFGCDIPEPLLRAPRQLRSFGELRELWGAQLPVTLLPQSQAIEQLRRLLAE